VWVALTVKETGEVKEQQLFMGDFPLMTNQGTFIINGAERVVVSQLVRSPGVYFTLEADPTSGRDLCFAKLIPNRGAWLEFEVSNKDVVSVKVDRKRKIPVTTLLRCIDTDDEITDDSKLGTDERVLALFEDIDTHPDHKYIQATLERDSSKTKQEALLDFYKRLRPGDPPTQENARGLIVSLFFNPRRYDLGRVGRYKVNKRLKVDIPTTTRTLVVDDLRAIVAEIIRMTNGIGHADDIDHLGNRRVRAVES
jgi:DNA-directed RNA polymerase subunit beta